MTMAEEDIFAEMPTEPQIAVPKDSLVARESHLLNRKTCLYSNVNILRPLNKAKFPVYLANCGARNKSVCAMKVFPLDGEHSSLYFKNEIRFAKLDHPNIIKTFHFEEVKTILYKGDYKTISFILSEFAPYGDFFHFVTRYKEHLTEKLIRTYFRQLIEGLEYLHNKNVVHLDLKLENLLIGEDFKLKIADFDLSQFSGDNKIETKGSKFYRAPELIKGECKDGKTADIYSAGILLFILKSGGVIPHLEDIVCREINLMDLLYNNNSEFWEKHCQLQNKHQSCFSSDFRKLFNGMTQYKAQERLNIQQIKNSRWYNGPTYCKSDLKQYVQTFLKP